MSFQAFEKSKDDVEGLGRHTKGEKRPHNFIFLFF
jgi:hypothetical protein